MNQIAENYEIVQERIVRAAQRAGRDPAAVTLVAVTKTWPVSVLLTAYAAGMRHFGENRVEELAEKRPLLEAELTTDNGLVWHFIGSLQSRKTAQAADLADTFHALDRLKIGQRLALRLGENGRLLPTFLEVNISGEASKVGLPVYNWEEDAAQREALQTAVAQIAQLPGIQLQGLMTMAPWQIPDQEIRTIFRRTRQLSAWLQAAFPQLGLTQLSMGMTDDFEIAIEEGATHIRVGRALFGERG